MRVVGGLHRGSGGSNGVGTTNSSSGLCSAPGGPRLHRYTPLISEEPRMREAPLLPVEVVEPPLNHVRVATHLETQRYAVRHIDSMLLGRTERELARYWEYSIQ